MPACGGLPAPSRLLRVHIPWRCRKHEGAAVTVASFTAWRERFEREMEEKRKADEEK